MIILLIRYLLFGIIFFLFGLATLLIGIVRPFNPQNNALVASWFRHLFFLVLGLEVELRHAERISQAWPAIFVGNHQNALDLFLFGFAMPPGTVAIGKKSVLWIPFFGIGFALFGNILIDRKKHESAMQTMERVREQLSKGSISVFIMPEGTRNREKGIGPFKKGAFYLAVQSQYPITPIVASSLYQGRIDFRRWKAGKVILEVLPPVITQGKEEKDVDSLMSEVRESMVKTFALLEM